MYIQTLEYLKDEDRLRVSFEQHNKNWVIEFPLCNETLRSGDIIVSGDTELNEYIVDALKAYLKTNAALLQEKVPAVISTVDFVANQRIAIFGGDIISNIFALSDAIFDGIEKLVKQRIKRGLGEEIKQAVNQIINVDMDYLFFSLTANGWSLDQHIAYIISHKIYRDIFAKVAGYSNYQALYMTLIRPDGLNMEAMGIDMGIDGDLSYNHEMLNTLGMANGYYAKNQEDLMDLVIAVHMRFTSNKQQNKIIVEKHKEKIGDIALDIFS